MLSQAEAIIYLSDHRGCSQSEWYRSYHTISPGTPVGKLQVLNDDTLKAGTTRIHAVAGETAVLLIPLVGAVQYRRENGGEGSLDVGEAHILLLPAGSELRVTNTYKNELINYLQLWFTMETNGGKPVASKCEFDLAKYKNKLIGLRTVEGPELPGTRILIGNYEGRNEGTYQLKDPAKGVFVFIVDGAFEVQDRLLQSRDALWVSRIHEMEFEVLSREGVIIVIEEE